MAVRASAQKLLAWGKEHGGFVSLVVTTLGGAVLVTKQVEGLKKDLSHERELRKEELEHERELRKEELEHERELRKEELEHERELRKELQQRTDLGLKHERQLRKELQQRTDLLVKSQLFDILHQAEYEAAARALQRSEASPAAHPSTD